MMMTINQVPQPIIAKVHGIANAAGCQLVAACGLAVVAEGTRFATSGINIGLFCSTPRSSSEPKYLTQTWDGIIVDR